MSIRTFTISNKKTFPVDAATGARLVTLADLEDISNFTITCDEAAGPTWIQVDKTYADWATAGLTNNLEVYSLPAGAIIHAAIIRPTTNFSGGAISDYDITLGITGTETKYCAGADVDSGTQANATNAALIPESWTAATSIKAFATSVGANLSAATAGAVSFYLLVSETVEI
jgi:hypothetical protein